MNVLIKHMKLSMNNDKSLDSNIKECVIDVHIAQLISTAVRFSARIIFHGSV
jgi:hypothetical protein